MQPCRGTCINLLSVLLLLLFAATARGTMPTPRTLIPSSTPQAHHSAICSFNSTATDHQNISNCSVGRVPCTFINHNRTFHYMGMCTSTTSTVTSTINITSTIISSCSIEETIANTAAIISAFFTTPTSASRSLSDLSPSPAITTTMYITSTCSPTSCGSVAMDTTTTLPQGCINCSGYTNMVTTTTIYTTTFSPTITSCSPATTIYTNTIISPTITTSCGPVADTLPATLHGVYMTVLLVLVAVTITMTTLVVYMCLMMRRAKSGRVPQPTTGTTHTNNMAASDYCEPISLRHFQNINEEPMYTEPVDTLQQHSHNCRGEQQQLKCTLCDNYLGTESR